MARLGAGVSLAGEVLTLCGGGEAGLRDGRCSSSSGSGSSGGNNNNQYGKGIKQKMPFREFVARAAAGDATLYMTAQPVATGPDGHPELAAPPALQLLGAPLPLHPSPPMPEALVPQSVNVWMGAAGRDGASSGLHHDFHDNLYVLLRGRKRFRLWPPAALPNMYTVGRPAALHANGRIVYHGQGDVAADVREFCGKGQFLNKQG
jgi:hypothetical protein